MGEFKYARELLKSFCELFKKPKLLTPFIGIFVISTIFMLLAPKIPNYAVGQTPDYGLIAWVGGLLIIQGLITLLFSAVGLAGFKTHTDGEEIQCGPRFISGAKMYFKLLLLRIYQILIYLAIPALILLLLYLVASLVSQSLANIVLIIMLILFVFYFVMMVFFFIFSNVIIAYDRKGAGESLKEAYSYFKNDSAHTFFTIVSVVLLLVVYWLAVMLITLIFTLVGGVSATAIIWREIIISFISIPLGATMFLFLFKAYKNEATVMPAKAAKTTKAIVATPAKTTIKKVIKNVAVKKTSKAVAKSKKK